MVVDIYVNITSKEGGKPGDNLIRFRHKITDAAMPEILEKLAFEIQKNARQRAPKWTGELTKSIKVTSVIGKGEEKQGIKVTLGSPYGAAQELGFRSHFLKPSTSTRIGMIFGDWLVSHGQNADIVAQNKGVRVSNAYKKGFMSAAVQSVRSRASKYIRPILKKYAREGK